MEEMRKIEELWKIIKRLENQFEKWKKSRVLEKRIKQVIESIDWHSFYESDSLKATILYLYDLNVENRRSNENDKNTVYQDIFYSC